MTPKFRIDRHFLFLHNEKLVVFVERILRSTVNNSYVEQPNEIWTSLKEKCTTLRELLNSRYRRKPDAITQLRNVETAVLSDLNRFADHIEQQLEYRSDVHTTGFRLQTEQRKPVQTLRKQRLEAKLQKIATQK